MLWRVEKECEEHEDQLDAFPVMLDDGSGCHEVEILASNSGLIILLGLGLVIELSLSTTRDALLLKPLLVGIGWQNFGEGVVSVNKKDFETNALYTSDSVKAYKDSLHDVLIL